MLLERRKELHFTTTSLKFGNGQGLVGLGFIEFVRFGQKHQKFETRLDSGPDDFEQNVIKLRQSVSGVAQEHHANEVFAGHQIIGHDLLPADFVLFGNSRVAVAGQIGQHRVGQSLATQCKEVDVLRAPRCF